MVDHHCFRGQVTRFAPSPNQHPHLWVLLHALGDALFATLNVQSTKDEPGASIEASAPEAPS